MRRLICAMVTVVASWLPASAPAIPGNAGDPGVIVSHRAPSDWAPTADPEAPPWKGATGVWAEKDRRGEIVPGHRTEIRSRWTAGNLPEAESLLEPGDRPPVGV